LGFFDLAEIETYPNCPACKLYENCLSPKMEIGGDGEKGILVVAEAPGADEDELGTQLVGDAGEHLSAMLERLGIDLHRDCWKVNAVNCRPPGNRTPKDNEIQACRPKVYEALRKQPSVVLVLGSSAIKSVIGPDYRDNTALGKVGIWVGQQIPSHRWNTWLCPTYHPSYLIRQNDDALETITENHIRLALETMDRPVASRVFDPEPVFLYTEEEIKYFLTQYSHSSRKVAFDYETTGLKPQAPGQEVVSMGISDGKDTVAFMIEEGVMGAVRSFLASDVPKIAANLKFEEAWSRTFFGQPVRNWRWDTMATQHFLDNRPGIASVQFQAFVRYGVQPYNEEVESYLKTRNSNGLNKIRELPTHVLLRYNAMDAALEWRIAKDQLREHKQMRIG